MKIIFSQRNIVVPRQEVSRLEGKFGYCSDNYDNYLRVCSSDTKGAYKKVLNCNEIDELVPYFVGIAKEKFIERGLELKESGNSSFCMSSPNKLYFDFWGTDFNCGFESDGERRRSLGRRFGLFREKYEISKVYKRVPSHLSIKGNVTCEGADFFDSEDVICGLRELGYSCVVKTMEEERREREMEKLEAVRKNSLSISEVRRIVDNERLGWLSWLP